MNSRFFDRIWLLVVALVPWLVQPGRVQPDTKVDLTLDPWTYLGRSLTAWNEHNGLGELQNQAYGYLFPMGPVFGLGHSLRLPDWVVQRIWWTLLLVVAFTGARTLIRRLGVAGATASMVGATSYALSPRVLTLLSDHSIEAWPGAVAPWIAVAALKLTEADLDRRARLHHCASIGLLVFACGGVNATASAIAVLPALLLLVCHPRGRRRLAWALVAVVLGSVVWTLPLLVLGGFAYPFLAYIETASITTAVTSVPNVLRGANNWIAYILDDEGHPVWQGGWVVAQSLSGIVLTSMVAAFGTLGVLRLPGFVRRFAVVSIVVGTIAMAIGHPGVAGGPFAPQIRELLDGPLVVFRNVHKFDLLVRLPMAIGLSALAGLLAHEPARTLLMRRARAGAVLLITVAAMVPLWQGRLGSDASYTAVPASWRTAAATIDQLNAGGGSTLLLPSSRTASYTWGRSTDEPLSALARTPIVVRASAPLGHPGATRLLDAIDALAASGSNQPALATTLSRSGISTIVVRKDLAANAGAGDWRSVERTLSSSPGFARVDGQSDVHRSLWRVSVRPSSNTGQIVMAGGAEALPAALATGALRPDTAAVLLGDTRQRASLVTDSLAWRAYHNGAPVQRAYGPVLAASDREPAQAGSRDLPPSIRVTDRPHRQLQGLRAVAVSSSAADPFAKAYVSVAHSQFAAFDADPTTTWLTGDHETEAHLRLDLAEPTTADVLTIEPAAGRGVQRPATITVNGITHRVPSNGSLHVPMSAGSTTVDLRLNAGEGTHQPVMGLAEVRLARRNIGSIITVPEPVDPRSSALLLGSDVIVPVVPARAGEDGATMRRRVTFTASASVPAAVWLRDAPSGQGCGDAGSLTIAGRTTPLRYTGDGSAGGLRKAVPCGQIAGEVSVRAGTQDVLARAAEGEIVHVLLGSPPHAVTPPLRVTTHGANAGWQSVGPGSGAGAAVVDGWRQAYHGSGDLHEEFVPTTWHRSGLALGAGLVLLLALAWWTTRTAVVPSRGGALRSGRALDDHSTAGGTRRATGVGMVLGVTVGTVVGGALGAAIGLAAALVPSRRRGEVAGAAMIFAGIALAAGGVVDQRSWGAAAGQVLGLVTVCVLAVEVTARGRSSPAVAPTSAKPPNDATPAAR